MSVAHLQEVTAARSDAEYVAQSPGQFLRQPSQVSQACVLVVEDVRGLLLSTVMWRVVKTASTRSPAMAC
ncbi:hypothetical protein [Streptomyces sp. NPDC054783]